MSNEKQSWFIRFTVKREGVSETMSGIITGDNASNALNSFVQHQVDTLKVSRLDVDVLAMNRV